jgi:putative nucleotidyltransferase with HDIG domain
MAMFSHSAPFYTADNMSGRKGAVLEKLEKINVAIEEPANLLIVDDEPEVLSVIQEMLETENYRLFPASSVEEARSILNRENVNIILTDLLLGDGSGSDILDEARKVHPDSLTIFMTGRPTVQNAIKLMKRGACDYLAKPFGLETLKMTLKKAREIIKLERENIRLKEMMSFYRISEAMGSAIELDELLNLILNTAIKEFEADKASIYFFHESEGRMELKASVDNTDEAIRNATCEHCFFVSMKVIDNKEPSLYYEPDSDFASDEESVRSSICQPLMAKGKVRGSLVVVRVKNAHNFTQGQLNGLGLLASKAAGAIENSTLYDNLKESYIATVRVLANAIEARDQYTRGHTERVYLLSEILAKELGWGEEQLGDLKMGGLLHDIGKIGVPDSILNKPGLLSPEEFEIMRQHPETGARMIESIPFLKEAIPSILYHHERHDGKGYPRGLRGDNIPYPGRLLAVVDTLDAITSDRPYRRGRSLSDAMEEIKQNSGTQFHPEVVDACIRAYKSGKLNHLFPTKIETVKELVAETV